MISKKDETIRERNRLQGLFTEDNFCLKFFYQFYPEYGDFSKPHKYRNVYVNERDQEFVKHRTGICYSYKIVSKLFQHEKSDVSYKIKAIDFELPNSESNYYSGFVYAPIDFRIMIYPYISEDYAKTLAVMVKSKCNCMFSIDYQCKGMDLVTFKKMLNQSGIRLVFEHELKINESITTEFL
jgi:hypothetical protein